MADGNGKVGEIYLENKDMLPPGMIITRGGRWSKFWDGIGI